MKKHRSKDAAEFLRALHWTLPASSTPAPAARPCNCIGPQNGDPVCPCQMRGVSVRNGRYVKVIDLGPAEASDYPHTDLND